MLINGIEVMEITAPGGSCAGCAGVDNPELCKEMQLFSGGCQGVIYRAAGRYNKVADAPMYGDFVSVLEREERRKKRRQNWEQGVG